MHSANDFLFQLFLIFVWAKFCGEVFERLRMPAVLGEILAGVLIGPYAAHLVEPSDAINDIAEVGAIFLLFTVGLEMHPKDLLSVGRTSLYVALAGIAVPFVCGFSYMMLRDHSAADTSAAGRLTMTTKAKQTKARESKPKKERPGVQLVLRIPAELKSQLVNLAHEARTSMNGACITRLATGRWPQARKGEKS